MDNLTHSLFGLTLGRTPLARAGRGTTAALLLASNAPDIDIVTTAGGAVNYLHWHRGPTHGLLGVIGLGFVAAALVWAGRSALDRRRGAAPSLDPPRNDASFSMLWVVSMVAVACHVLMDLPTSYGTRPLSPFSWQWYAEDWMPIIDVYLLAILLAGLWFGSRGIGRARERNAAIVLALMAANYGVRAVAHRQALLAAPRLFGPLLPAACADAPTPRWTESWPRGPIDDAQAIRERASRRCLVEVAALPSFTSPFAWRVVAQMTNGYEVHTVNVLDPRFRRPAERDEVLWRTATRYPNVWTPAAARAATTRTAGVFLGFSRFPVVRSSIDAFGNAIVQWRDMRFVMEGPQVGRGNLFTATVRLDSDGGIVEERFGP